MQEYIAFAQNNIMLFGMLVVCICAIIWVEIKLLSSRHTRLGTSKLVQMLNNDDIYLVDVRPEKQYKAGHIQSAKHAKLSDVESALSKVPKDKKVVIYCQMGNQAGRANVTLKKAGYTQLFQLTGGMQAWLDAKLPVEK